MILLINWLTSECIAKKKFSYSIHSDPRIVFLKITEKEKNKTKKKKTNLQNK